MAQSNSGETDPAAGAVNKQAKQRRQQSRCRVEEDANLVLLNQGTPLACIIEDLSLGGCRLRMEKKFLAGTMVRAEVNFKVCGVAQKLIGVTQWTDGDRVVGIRFVDMSERRASALAESISDVEIQAAIEAKLAAEEEAEQSASESDAAASAIEAEALNDSAIANPRPSASTPAAPVPGDPNSAHTAPVASANSAAATTSAESKSSAEKPRERRAHPRLNVDSNAIIRLVDLAADIPGRIIDLSVGGCLIHTTQRFPVGIFRRVETEFRLNGLPFRLGGVTQTIYDPHRVGIRFLDMSDRKREQLLELVAEVMESTEETDTASEHKSGPILEQP